MERELEALKKQAESDRKQIDELSRTRDVLSKKIVTAGEQTNAYDDMIQVSVVMRLLLLLLLLLRLI